MAPGFLVSRFVLITLILFQGMFCYFLSWCFAKIMSKTIVEECDICCTFLYLVIFKNNFSALARNRTLVFRMANKPDNYYTSERSEKTLYLSCSSLPSLCQTNFRRFHKVHAFEVMVGPVMHRFVREESSSRVSLECVALHFSKL